MALARTPAPVANVTDGATALNFGNSGTHATYHTGGGSFVDMPSFIATTPGKQFVGTSYIATDQPATYASLQDFTIEFLLRPET